MWAELYKHHFYLKKWLWFFRLDYLADIFSKMKWASTNDKIQAFKWKLKFRIICICYHHLDKFKILKRLFWWSCDDFNECDFFPPYIVQWNVSTFGRLALLSKPIFFRYEMHDINHAWVRRVDSKWKINGL